MHLSCELKRHRLRNVYNTGLLEPVILAFAVAKLDPFATIAYGFVDTDHLFGDLLSPQSVPPLIRLQNQREGGRVNHLDCALDLDAIATLILADLSNNLDLAFAKHTLG